MKAGEAWTSLIGKTWDTGRGAEPAPPAPDRGAADAAGQVSGSVQVRHVDTGSCNGCEIEIGQAFSPVYDAERYGIRMVASPRHADALVVTGPVTRNMAAAQVKTNAAAPQPCFHRGGGGARPESAPPPRAWPERPQAGRRCRDSGGIRRCRGCCPRAG